MHEAIKKKMMVKHTWMSGKEANTICKYSKAVTTNSEWVGTAF